MNAAVLTGAAMADGPSSLSLRVATDLVEMARVICALSPKGKGKAMKQTEYIDSILRPRITRDYAAVMARVKKDEGA